jgi:carboxypeptidase family protein
MSNAISGNVVGTSGSALVGAQISLTNVIYSSQSQPKSAVTDSNGNYTFSGLGPGTYSLTATSNGVSFHHSQIVTISATTATTGGTINSTSNGVTSAIPTPLINTTVTPQDVTGVNFTASALTAANS